MLKKSYFHSGGEQPLLGVTIPEHFAEIVEKFGSREAVVSLPQKRRLSYKELALEIDRLAAGLLAMGFGRGDRVGIWSTNNIEWLLLQMATARLGIILVDINPANGPRELEYALNRSRVQALFVIPSFKKSDYVSMLVELMPELKTQQHNSLDCNAAPAMRRIVLYDPTSNGGTKRPFPGLTVWAEVIEAGRAVSSQNIDAVTVRLDPDDPINIQYTSGTTGSPKAVMLSHHNILNNASSAARIMRFTESDRLCVPVPFYHCFGMVLANLLCLSVGACVVIPSESFDVLPVLRAVEAEKCTALHGVPTMFIAELEHPQFADFDLSSLRTGIIGGAPCPPELMKRITENMHCKYILQAYGQTEASPLTHLTSPDDSLERRATTVGTNLPHQEVKIVNTETSITVPRGEVGEICFRGYHIMKGYYGDEEATRQAIDRNGWLHSGDLGTMDESGYVSITGRLKNMIIRGGENIYPIEIEDVIFTHPKVAQVAVFGIPDEFYGEEVAAWVQLHAGETASSDDIREFCNDKLAHFKIPRHIEFVNDFPMTVTGKLQKFRMRELTIEALRQKNKRAATA